VSVVECTRAPTCVAVNAKKLTWLVKQTSPRSISRSTTFAGNALKPRLKFAHLHKSRRFRRLPLDFSWTRANYARRVCCTFHSPALDSRGQEVMHKHGGLRPRPPDRGETLCMCAGIAFLFHLIFRYLNGAAD
jgi:hypothetical protein